MSTSVALASYSIIPPIIWAIERARKSFLQLNLSKNPRFSRKKSQIRASQIFLDTIQNRVPSRPALLKAAYLKALLYNVKKILLYKSPTVEPRWLEVHQEASLIVIKVSLFKKWSVALCASRIHLLWLSSSNQTKKIDSRFGHKMTST